MSTTTHVTTAAELAALPDDGWRYELLEGDLVMMSPAGSRHGRVAMRLGSLLEQHVHRQRLGAVYAAETGFLLSRNPDTVRAPDVAFVRRAALMRAGESDGYLPLAPDLAAEVISPSETLAQAEEKAFAWLAAGSSLVLVVDPRARTVRVDRSTDATALLHEADILDASDVVPGWKLPVREIFA